MAISTKPPTGTRDLLPEHMAQRRQVIGVIEDVYQRYGFQPLETPAFEKLNVLLGKYGDEGDKLIFRLMHRGDKLTRALERGGDGEALTAASLGDLGLRYDLTVPLARVVAQHSGKLPGIFRRYQIQPVWRADRPGRGRFREFYQCDADIVGSTSLTVEAELLGAVCEVFATLGFDDLQIGLNHRQLLRALIEAAGIPAELETDTLVALDKLDKVGVDGVLKELDSRGINTSAMTALKPVLTQAEDADNATRLALLEPLVTNTERGPAALADLRRLLELAESTPAAGRLALRPVLARGLGYYTGPIFEITVPDLAGSLAGGGRYDGLIGMFSGRDVPACGIALGLERILVVMQERGMFAEVSGGPDILVTCFSDELTPDSLRLAGELRQAGLAVEVHPKVAKLGKQLKVAANRHIPLAAILAPGEVEAGTVQFKDLRAGQQHEVPRAEAAALARKLLSDD